MAKIKIKRSVSNAVIPVLEAGELGFTEAGGGKLEIGQSTGTNKVLGSQVEIVDDLVSTDTNKALSANQGKELKDLIDAGSAPDPLDVINTGSSIRAHTGEVIFGQSAIKPSIGVYSGDLAISAGVSGKKLNLNYAGGVVDIYSSTYKVARFGSVNPVEFYGYNGILGLSMDSKTGVTPPNTYIKGNLVVQGPHSNIKAGSGEIHFGSSESHGKCLMNQTGSEFRISSVNSGTVYIGRDTTNGNNLRVYKGDIIVDAGATVDGVDISDLDSQVQGLSPTPAVTKTADYSPVAGDTVMFNNTTVPTITFTLPATPSEFDKIRFQSDAATATGALVTSASHNIQGLATDYAFSGSYPSVTLEFVSGAWWIT